MPVNRRRDTFSYRKSHLRHHVGLPTKAACQLCGRPLDDFHNGPACTERWLKAQDEQGNPSNVRRSS